MSKNILFISFFTYCFLFFSCNKRSGKPRVLLFTKTAGYVHQSIPAGIAAIQKLGQQNNFIVDTTSNAAWFQQDSLAKYAAVIFLSTTDTSDVLLNHYQEAEFERYIQAGGGFVGIHAASDAEYHWGWYGRLVGAYFHNHPEIQPAVLNVVNAAHPSTKSLPKEWKRTDEWYNFKIVNPNVKVVLTIDEKSYKGGANGDPHPMAWYHEYDGGRAFYTALGHTSESYSEPEFLQHILGGIQYAMDDNIKLNYSKAHTPKVPEADRFLKTMLTEGTLFEPTEMAILPDLDVLIAQRRGEIMLYSNASKEIKQVGFLSVYHQTNIPGVNAEEGLMGLALDPNFKNNKYIYAFYSPYDTSVNRLSRFEFTGDTIDKRSEKVVLEFYSQREICCHTGGSIAFGKNNLLYLSTGDNSTPFDAPNQAYVNHGYAPLDDRPGQEQYDARRTSGNTADLRGKILRIRIKADGTYSIPEGNLFPNHPQARPEIYVMGNRNPYRISIDQQTGFLYWGEVGPDANVDSFETRGPRGYDEVNQARGPGFFGWPLFVANNQPYREYNYGTGKGGSAFEAAKPINSSRNNKGIQQLPAAQIAFIYYPYGFSKDFPQVGTGGRNAMAGPVYYMDEFPKKTRYPDYFNGKLFIYDWIRGWIKLVRMMPGGDFDKMDAFVETEKFNNPIDMEVGPDGKIYVLEYGSGWFAKNPDAGLSRIDYIPGNRPPKIVSLRVDKESGRLPFTVTANVHARDPEGDAINYIWNIGKNTIETKEPRLQHLIKEPGEYRVSVTVVDKKNASAESTEVTVYAGNQHPEVDIVLQGNQTFYFPGKPLQYQVKVSDDAGTIDTSNMFVATDYIESSEDLAGQGHQVVPETIVGRNIMLSSDCKACHKTDEKSVGPSYIQIAQRYKKESGASSYLIEKIIKGSAGVWGEVAMPAHPDMKESDVKMMTAWILSLGNQDLRNKSLPVAGSITPKEDPRSNIAFAITASYTNIGAAGVRPLTGSKVLYLRSNKIDAAQLKTVEGTVTKDSAGSKYIVLPAVGWIRVDRVDLSGISNIELTGFGTGETARYIVEIRTGTINGPKAGEAVITFNASKQRSVATVPVQTGNYGKVEDVYIIYRKISTGAGGPLIKMVRFVLNSKKLNI